MRVDFASAKRRELFLKGGVGHEESKVQLQDSYRKVKYEFDN